jgi:hypothetical protein
MERYLEERHPERFRGIQEQYDGLLDAIDKKMVELEQIHV